MVVIERSSSEIAGFPEIFFTRLFGFRFCRSRVSVRFSPFFRLLPFAYTSKSRLSISSSSLQSNELISLPEVFSTWKVMDFLSKSYWNSDTFKNFDSAERVSAAQKSSMEKRYFMILCPFHSEA